MATHIPTPIIHVYKEINIGKYTSTKHFELIEVKNGTPTLSNKLNLSTNRNCALSMPIYWIKEREVNKWAKKWLTGMFKTETSCLYYGDTQKRKNLLIFKYCKSQGSLKIYFFKNYYTKDLNAVKHFITD
ncbi:hypothetical protein ACXGQW_05535 [Wenyingzhuangia sp. IMCC45533]